MKSERASLQHRPFLIPIWLSAIAAFVALAFAVAAAATLWMWFTASSTVVVVVAADSVPSAAGDARGAALAHMFGATQGVGRLDAIYVSDAVRSRSTAAPLAARLGLVPIVDSADDSKALVRRVLRENRGKRVLLVGVDRVPELVAALWHRSDIPNINEQDFGWMYVVTVPRIGHANLIRLSY